MTVNKQNEQNNIDSNLGLDELCLTASSLSSVLLSVEKAREKDDEDIYIDALYEKSIDTIRRLYGVKTHPDSCIGNAMTIKEKQKQQMMADGKKYEKLILDKRFNDPRYAKQKCFKTNISIYGTIIPLRATLDIWDTQENKIIEIKSPYLGMAYFKEAPHVDGESYEPISQINKDLYAEKYIPQVQVQYLCAKDSIDEKNPPVNPKSANILIYSQGKLFTSNNIPFDPNFIEENQLIILEFWEELNRFHDLYLAGDKQTMLDVHKFEDFSKIFQDDSLMEDFLEYAELAKKSYELEERKKLLKHYIVKKLEHNQYSDIPLPFLRVKKTKGAETIRYSQIVKDKFDFNSLTEEEKNKYISPASPAWRFTLRG